MHLARYCDSLDGGDSTMLGSQGLRAAEARRRYAQAHLLLPSDGERMKNDVCTWWETNVVCMCVYIYFYYYPTFFLSLSM